MTLTPEQKVHLLQKINEKVNIPLLGEEAEKKFFLRIIDRIIEKLEEKLSDDLLNYLNDISMGFILGDKKEMKEAINSTVMFLNKEINLPLLNEKKGEELFRIVVEVLFVAMKKGEKL